MMKLWQRLQDEYNSYNIQEVRPSLPFYYFLTAILTGMSYWALVNAPALADTTLVIVYIVLFILHILLHWSSLFLPIRPGLIPYYLGAQVVLAFSLSLISGYIGLVVALFMALLGEAVGIFTTLRDRAISILVLLVVMATVFFLVVGYHTLQSWIFPILLTAIFVIFYVVLYTRQGEARSRAQALATELEVANRRLSEYNAQVEELTLTAERQRMARELHDTLAQGLAGLILQLEAADSHLSAGRTERADTIIRQAMSRARATLADSRRVIDQLRAGEVGPYNLEESILEEVRRFSESTGIPCDPLLELSDFVPPPTTEQAYRAVCEGLSNAARHARCTKVVLHLYIHDHSLVIEIWDNGQGFDPVEAIGRAGHYGLLGMRERARLAGGTLEIDSSSGKGTCLKMSLPYDNEVYTP